MRLRDFHAEALEYSAVDKAAQVEAEKVIAVEKLCAAVLEAFEHGVCVKARFTTRGDKWRVTHADAIQIALNAPRKE